MQPSLPTTPPALTTPRRHFFRHLSLVCLVFMIGFGASAYGQVGKDAVAAMQEQGAQEGWTFTVGENGATQFSLDQLCGLVEPDDWQSKARFDPMVSTAKSSLPAAFDWRDVTGLPPVRNQGGCGSCWAFATVGALECNIQIRDGETVDLSEQWLVSCNRSGWDCSGGWYAHGYHGWFTDACGGTGAVLEADFPYVAYDAGCSCPYDHHYVLNNWAYVGSAGSVPDIAAMKQAILEYGPISVSVYAGGVFQSYNSGIFNYCQAGDINHSVVLVGWDDSQGEDGVWIMRNSWGRWWGENGYMRIAYDCNLIGYAACYVDYRPVRVTCDVELGPVPLAVAFESGAPDATITSCSWDFGDGAASEELNPVHVYDEPGCYTVTLNANTSDGPRTKICPNLISAYADTLRGDVVEIVEGGPVRLDVFATNSLTVNQFEIPFQWQGSFGLDYDSFSVAGTRTEYFQTAVMMSFDPSNDRAVLFLQAGSEPALPVGQGRILSLWFTVPPGVSGVNPIAFVNYSMYSPKFHTSGLSYPPSAVDGLFHTGISVSCCEGTVGDVNVSGEDRPTIGDVSALIDHLFVTGAALGCVEEADINQSGGTLPTYEDITIGDVSMLIDHLFLSGSPLADCL